MIEWSAIREYTQIPFKSAKLTDREYQLNLKEVTLSRGDVGKEIATGKPCTVRVNVEEKKVLGSGYSVYPEWQDILDEIGEVGR